MATTEVTVSRPESLRDDAAYVFHHPPKFLWESEKDIPRQRWNRYSIYVHVPFCKKICTFCTFERKRLRRGSIGNFAEHLWRELDVVESLDDFSAADVHSVYIGGGTGSLLPNEDIARLVHELRTRFGLRDAEVTLECEPGTKDADDFAQIRDSGVNRISVGIQAFQDDVLKRLNRSHDSAQAVQTVQAAVAAGFPRVHIDLMYGLPGQTVEQWQESLDRALGLGVNHISAYQLIVFHDELQDRLIRSGDSPAIPPRDDIDRMRDICRDRLAAAGYPQYSLTEYAQPDHHCDYVVTTWDGSDYLGLGPAAYSRSGRWLWENELIHAAYERKVMAGERPVGRGIAMAPVDQLRRDVAMSLCMLSVDVAPLERAAGVTVDLLAEERDSLVADGLLAVEGSTWSLTRSGIKHATEVMKRFAADS